MYYYKVDMPNNIPTFLTAATKFELPTKILAN
jgi:hypothetical protein